MKKTVACQLGNDKVIQYLQSFQMSEDISSNQFVNVNQHRLRSGSENDSDSTLSDPCVRSSSISSDEFDFSIGFEQYSSNESIPDAITLLNESISDDDPSDEDQHDSEQSIDAVLRSNSFSELPFDEQKKFVGTTPKKIVHFADMMVNYIYSA